MTDPAKTLIDGHLDRLRAHVLGSVRGLVVELRDAGTGRERTRGAVAELLARVSVMTRTHGLAADAERIVKMHSNQKGERA